MVGPSRPSSPISRKIFGSVVSVRKASSTRGSRRSWLYAAAASRTARSSSVSCWSSSSGSAQWKAALEAIGNLLALVGQNGSHFDLDLGPVLDQRLHFDRRHGDVVVADQFTERRPDALARGQVFALVGDVPGHPDDIFRLCAGRAQHV